MSRESYFTIIIPAFNREKEVVRAVKSCLIQKFNAFQVIVVDDGSKDGTRDAVQRLVRQDSRVLLIQHRNNMGVCPARNTGIQHSSGQWILFLDSDDEFVANAFEEIYEETKRCPPNVGRIGFLYSRADGRTSPEPAFDEQILDYEKFIAWRAQENLTDFFHCTRRSTFAHVRFASGRGYEETYLLDFARKYQTKFVPRVVAKIYLDSKNRASNLSIGKRSEGFLRDAPDQALDMKYLLEFHGDALKKNAATWYWICKKAMVLYQFLSGNRGEGIREALRYLRARPTDRQVYVVLVAGTIHSRLLAILKAWKVKRYDWNKV